MDDKEYLVKKNEELKAKAIANLKANAPAGIKDVLVGMMERVAVDEVPQPRQPGNSGTRGRVDNVPALFQADDMTDPLKLVLRVPTQVTTAAVALNQELMEWNAKKSALPGWLIHGPYGVGKTGVAIEAMRFAAKEFKACCRFEKVQAMLARVKETFGDESGTKERDVVAFYTGFDLLTVDEVGAQWATEAERNIIYWIVVGRYEALRPTIFTTNFDPNTEDGRQQLADCLGDRVIARFKEHLVDAGKWGENLRAVSK